jgi:DNA-binding response OmpR family regulator
MIVISRDAGWLARLEAVARRGSWPFHSRAALPAAGRVHHEEHSLAVVDRAAAGASLGKAVAAARAAYPAASVVLAFDAVEMSHDGLASAVSCGADEVLGKAWPDSKITSRLSALRDRSLAAQARLSSDGGLKAERRSHRAFVLTRGKWKELPLDAGAFALLWVLLGREGQAVTREALGEALAGISGREREAGTVARRLTALRASLTSWKGSLETVRGGGYRLSPPL